MSLHYRLTLTRPAAVIEASDLEARTLAGIALPYGEAGDTSAGRVSIDAGAVRIPDNLRSVKLFREHGRENPIGYALTADDTPEALHMSFRVAATDDGDRALLEASEGLRDALSVELADVTINAGRVTAATLVGVAQVAVPAFSSAVLTAALTDEQQADVNDLAQQIVDATAPEDEPTDDDAAAPADDNPFPQESEADMPDDETTTASRPMGMTPGPARTAPRMDFAAACAAISAAHTEGRSLTAALTDIVPANDVGGGALPPQWINEIWTPVAVRRNFIESISSAVLSSGLKVYGWQWNVYPTVSTYAGNKGAVPSSSASTKAVETPVKRLAGGWDLDRIYVDLGEAGFVEAFFQAAVRDLALKQEGDVAAVLAAGATNDGTQADVWAMINDAAASLSSRGASLTFCALSADLWATYVTTPTATVPWWVPNGSSPQLGAQTGTAADVAFFMAPGLAAGTLIAGDRNAATFYEPSPNPVRVNAVNLPNGGVDLGVFGYHAILINDARGLSKVTKTP